MIRRDLRSGGGRFLTGRRGVRSSSWTAAEDECSGDEYPYYGGTEYDGGSQTCWSPDGDDEGGYTYDYGGGSSGMGSEAMPYGTWYYDDERPPPRGWWHSGHSDQYSGYSTGSASGEWASASLGASPAPAAFPGPAASGRAFAASPAVSLSPAASASVSDPSNE